MRIDWPCDFLIIFGSCAGLQLARTSPDEPFAGSLRLFRCFPETRRHTRPFDSVRSRWRSDRWARSLPLMLSSSAALRSRAAHQTASSSVRLGPYCCTYGSIKPLFKPATSKPLQKATPGPLCLRSRARVFIRGAQWTDVAEIEICAK